MSQGLHDRRHADRVVALDKPAALPPHGGSAPPGPERLRALEAWLAGRDGAEGAAVVASGAAALACALLALLRPGDHLVAADLPEGHARDFLAHELPALGMEADLVPAGDARAWRRARRPTTRVLLVECPAEDADTERLLRTPRVLAREGGVVLVALVPGDGGRPLALGADVVVRTTTAPGGSEGGEGLGVVCGAEAVVEEVRLKAVRWGMRPVARGEG